jgi:hypothetical protein
MIPERWLWKTLEAAAGFRAWPIEAPQGEAVPYAVFQRTGTAREHHFTGAADSPLATFAVAVYSAQYMPGKEAAERIRLAVDNFTGAADGVTILSALLTEESDGQPVDFTGEGKSTYVVDLVFEIRFAEGTK